MEEEEEEEEEGGDPKGQERVADTPAVLEWAELRLVISSAASCLKLASLGEKKIKSRRRRKREEEEKEGGGGMYGETAKTYITTGSCVYIKSTMCNHNKCRGRGREGAWLTWHSRESAPGAGSRASGGHGSQGEANAGQAGASSVPGKATEREEREKMATQREGEREEDITSHVVHTCTLDGWNQEYR